MALLFCDGFDHYASADGIKKYTWAAGTIQSTSGRRGGGAYNANGNQTYALRTIPASSSLIVGAAYKWAVNAAAVPIFTLFSSNSAQVAVCRNVDGTLSIKRGDGVSGTVLGTTAAAYLTSTWYYIEFKVTISDSISTGTCELMVNGASALTLSAGADTKALSGSTANQVSIGIPGTNHFSDHWFDDFYICDTTGSTNNNFLGDVRVDTLLPSADGTYTGLTPSTGTSHFATVDDTTLSTTDYNASSTVNAKDTYALTDLASSTGTIFGVQVCNAMTKDDAGTRAAANLIRSGSTDAQGAALYLAAGSTIYNVSVHETNPATSAAWTDTAVNALEAGAIVTV